MYFPLVFMQENIHRLKVFLWNKMHITTPILVQFYFAYKLFHLSFLIELVYDFTYLIL